MVETEYYVTVERGEVTAMFATLEAAVKEWGSARLLRVVGLTHEEYEQANQLVRQKAHR